MVNTDIHMCGSVEIRVKVKRRMKRRVNRWRKRE